MKILRLVTSALLFLIGVAALIAVLNQYLKTVTVVAGSNFYIQLVFTTALVLAGHSLRIQRARILLRSASIESTFASQTRPLFIGLAANVFLPMKIGEVFRAVLLAKDLNISKIYAFSVIAVERLLDVALISWLFIFATLSASTNLMLPFTQIAWVSASVSSALLIFLSLAIRENKLVFSSITGLSRTFNPSIEYRIQHSLYAVIHGYQVFLKSRVTVVKYFAYFISSWLFYVAAVGIIAASIFGSRTNFFDIISPLVAGGNLLDGSTLNAYSKSLSELLNAGIQGSHTTNSLMTFATATWLSLQASVAVIGAISMVSLVLAKQSRPTKPDANSASMIDRSNPQSRRLKSFIELYFERHQLAANFHIDDVTGKSKTIGFFKGGSDAITALVEDSGRLLVRKTVAMSHKEKLRGQYLWLRRNNSTPFVVRAIEEQTTKSLYSIDLEYRRDSKPFFDYIHSNPISSSTDLLRGIFESLSRNIWSIEGEIVDKPSLDAYLANRLYSRVNKALALDHNLVRISRAQTLIINGVRHRNLPELLSIIESQATSLPELYTFRPNAQMHGDLTVDNVLFLEIGQTALLIDPSDDNELRSTALEFARTLQSLEGGYEFLNDIKQPPDITFNDHDASVVINFPEATSKNYSELAGVVRKIAEGILTPQEYKTLDFHVGIFFARMLDHRVNINPATAPLYYSVAVRYLDNYFQGNK